MITISNLSETFDNGSIKALNNARCEIKRNTMSGFIGSDGAAKTIFMRIVTGIMTQDSGDICYFGNNHLPVGKLHEIMAYMLQKFGLYEVSSVIENVDLFAKLQWIQQCDIYESFQHILSMTHLSNFKDRLAGNLSGGMKQKLGLACSPQKAKMLILEEPSVEKR
jgi:ABC-2 type transport system ATP-binding protein